MTNPRMRILRAGSAMITEIIRATGVAVASAKMRKKKVRKKARSLSAEFATIAETTGAIGATVSPFVVISRCLKLGKSYNFDSRNLL